jgi:Na+-transporting NADH:ubiquinone oxidoreductase subunit C
VQVDSARYTVLFAAAVSVACALMVAASSVLLRDRQQANRLLYLQKNVLRASGLVGPGEAISDREVQERFRKHVRARLVDLESGDYAQPPGIEPERYDQRRARSDPAQSRPAPPNPAQIKRVPHLAQVYVVMDGDRAAQVVIPIEGIGLYGTLYGFLALDRDTTLIRGLAFYENRETPGLGGEVDNPKWRALWPGRKAFDGEWQPRIRLVKGVAGPPGEDPHHVDALSGATITSNGVTRMLAFWLGGQGFGPYLAKVRERGGP